MKKVYQKITVRTVEINPETAILQGSITDIPIQTGTVVVEDFKNGFGEGEAAFDIDL